MRSKYENRYFRSKYERDQIAILLVNCNLSYTIISMIQLNLMYNHRPPIRIYI